MDKTCGCSIEELLNNNYVDNELKYWLRKAGMLGTLNDFKFNICLTEYTPDYIKVHVGLIEYRGKQRKLILPPVDELSERALSGNKYVEHIILDSKTKVIKDGAFKHCFNLKIIDLSKTSVTKIPNQCFYECWNLENIIMPKTLKVLGTNVFLINNKIKELVLPSGLEEVHDDVITFCPNIERIVIPESVNYLGHHIIGHCENLKEIIILSNTLNTGVVMGDNLLNVGLDNLEAIYVKKSIKRIVKKRVYIEEYKRLIKIIK